MVKRYLEIGKIVSTHGLNGDFKVEPWCDTPEFLCGFKKLYSKDGRETFDVKSSRVQKNVVIMSFKDINTIDEAVLLRGKVLYIDRNDADIEEDVFFIQDIIGMKVYDADTQKFYGDITNVLKTGANDVYQVSFDGRDYLIPVIKDVVLNIDLENGRIDIRPIKGIFDDAD